MWHLLSGCPAPQPHVSEGFVKKTVPWFGLLPTIPQTGCRCHLSGSVRELPASDRYSIRKVLTKAPIFLLMSSPKDTPTLPVTPILSSSSFSDSQPFAAVMQVGRAETTGSRSQQLCVRLCRAFPNYLPEERHCCQTETEEGARERDGRQ